MSGNISYGSGIYEYCRISDVAAVINLFSTDSSGNYYIWDIAVPPATVQSQCDYANVFVSNQVGLQSGVPGMTSHVLAVDIAALRTLVLTTGGWVDASFNYNLGDISVQKGQAAQQALTNIVQQLKSDIDSILLFLSGHSKIGIANTAQRQFYSRSGSPLIY